MLEMCNLEEIVERIFGYFRKQLRKVTISFVMSVLSS